jgi:protein ImuB
MDAAGPAAPAISGPPGVGVADGRFAAILAARSSTDAGAPVVVAPGESAAFLAPFPIGAVDDDDLAGLLARLGITTLGSLAALPRGDVVARFGPPGGMAHRRASEGDDRPVDARSPPPDLTVQMELDPPATDVGPVVFAGKHLADDLAARIQELGLACTRLVVGVETEHGERLERCWRHDHAFNAARIVERVRWQLEGWASGTSAARPTGGITLLRLVPDEVVPDAGRQLGFWGGRTQADERAARTVARLVGLLGPDGVAVPEWRGGRDPGAVVAVAAGAVELAERARRVVAPEGSGPWPGRLPVPAPAVVLAERRAADVLDGDGRPVVVGGRGQLSAAPVWLRVGSGSPCAVVAWAGPWPADERWWDPAAHRRRARFQMLDETGVARLAVVEAGQWWVEADYD